MKLNVKIASPSEKFFSGELDQITIKTISGVVSILPEHAPYISLIENGYVRYNVEGKENVIDVESGNITVSNDSRVTILINKQKKVQD